MPRIPIEKIYMSVAYQFAKLSYAERRKVGSVIVKDEQIVSFGYNGTPHGFNNSCETLDISTGELTTNVEVLHAESNALAKIAKSTISSKGADLYVTMSPCFQCAKLIIQSGIKNVFYAEEYRDAKGIELLQKANINVTHVLSWNIC
jgi:dCMP deaminase|tara:strand:- start:1442 stop:1882 length:441 start_codon:yes stop_codon:yes gene_type:complete